MRRAIALNPSVADAHVNLGVFLIDLGDPAGAVKSLQAAIGLNPDSALAHFNLGAALLDQGRFADALAERRRGHELGAKQAGRQLPSDKYVRSAERFVALDQKLPAVLRKEIQPADVGDLLLYADICKIKKLYDTSVRFYVGAFKSMPVIVDERRGLYRYNAACVAALAGCGQGKDDPGPDEQARALLRKQSLEWLRAELALLKKQIAEGTQQASRAVQKTILQWRRDRNLACVRDPANLAALPESERDAFCEFWAEVARLFTQAHEAGMER
jgi:tetratricopeptide (TPR) repeat protein